MPKRIPDPPTEQPSGKTSASLDGRSDRLAYTIPEAVAVSSLSRSAIYEAISRKELTARKRGRRTLILASELRAYMQNLPRFGMPAPTSRAASPRGRREKSKAA